MPKVTILVLDSFGVGAAPDAEAFGDQGANTFAHIAKVCAERWGRPLHLPNLTSLGLVEIGKEASNEPVDLDIHPDIIGAYGYAKELSSGKDTPSGHWEIAGVPVLFDWGYFPKTVPSFPEKLIAELLAKTGVAAILGDCHASGTDIIKKHGDEHCATGKPICYTSADSVFQVAAHEEHFGLQKLYDFCEAARELLDEYNIGRVIARPFLGDSADTYKRTGNRRDYSVLPPEPTVLDKLTAAGGEVTSVGKISDIYAHQGITHKIKATGLPALVDATLEAQKTASDRSIVFTNLVDFDQEYGHRRDPEGYGKALEYYDTRIPEIIANLEGDDLLIMTADHGCDPTWPGTEHTREYIPVIVYSKAIKAGSLGERQSFADIGQTLAEYFDLPACNYGDSFLKQIF